MNQPTVRYGLICGLVYVIFGLVGIITSLPTQGQMASLGFNLVMMLGTFYVVYLGVKAFRETNGSLTVGQAVKTGVTIAFVASLVAAAFNILYTQVIDPGYMESMMAAMEEAWEEQGLTDEQIEGARSMTSFLKNPFLTAGVSIISTVFWGVLKGLVSGFMLKQEPEVAA